jgi:small subunit ribosomal protein S17
MDKNLENKTKPKGQRKFNGIVISDKMQKTITVKVEKVKIVPGIKKRIMRSKTYKVHDEKEQFKIGDKVSFVECRPLSKEKRWRVAK